MDKIRGTIQGFELGVTGVNAKTGKPWTRWVFKINDKKYSTFDKGIADNFKVGDFVEMEGEQKGEYWNMKTMKEANAEVVVNDIAKEIIEIVKPGAEKPSTQRYIVRQCVLKCAIETICSIPELRRKEIVPEITRMAEEFEDWVMR